MSNLNVEGSCRLFADMRLQISELGMVTTGGKVVWAKYAQVTNNPELDGCINAVLIVRACYFLAHTMS